VTLLSTWSLPCLPSTARFPSSRSEARSKLTFRIEPVLIHQADGSSRLHPNVEPRKTSASTKYINASVGLDLTPAAISTLLTQMSLAATPSPTDPSGDSLDVLVPCTRPDILHECDIMEDAAIAYGYNKLPKSLPRTNTVAKPFPVNRLADVLRKECAMAGWIEVLSLILVRLRLKLC
jgi:phenylalanyl-tRNA synthetase beta chain